MTGGRRAAVRMALFAAAVSGCGPTPPPPPCGAPGSRLVSQTVLVALWTHAAPTRGPGGSFAPGFDLDHRVDDGERSGCTGAEDFVSPITDAEGIDNQYSLNLLQLLEMDDMRGMTAIVAEQLLGGAFLYAIDVDVSPSAAGSPPRVTILELAPVAPLESDPATHALLGGQAFTIAGRIEVPSVCLETGELGILATTFDLPLGMRLGSRPVADAHFRFPIDPDGRITRGELGASVSFETVTSVFEVLAPELAAESYVRSLTAFDLEPDPTGANCDAVSIGLGIDLVSADVR